VAGTAVGAGGFAGAGVLAVTAGEQAANPIINTIIKTPNRFKLECANIFVSSMRECRK
jgi:hypothetical protein